MNAIDYFFQDTAGLEKDLIVSAKERCSYKEMATEVNKLASWIRETFPQGTVLLLISPNNNFFVKIYLSIIKAGCVVVPLNSAIEPSNLDFIKEKTSASHAFIHSSVLRRLNPEIEISDEIKVDSVPELYDEKNYEKGPDLEDDHLAEIIFTSGSTAVPKGVMITHGNLVANTNSILGYLHLKQNDTMLVVLPFFYCYGLSLLHTHLRVGGTLVLNNSFMFLGSVLRDLKNYRCTGFAGVPSHFQILLRKSDSFRNGHFPDLRYVTQAGGKLHKAFIAEFIELFPEVKFFVMYGQTEATARLSYLPPERLTDKLGSIGKGIPDVELKVVDENEHLVKPGQVGEIIAKGKNIMKGYFRDPESTNNAIKDEWLHTGDLGTVDEDGFIFLSARKKEMIKVGGKRVGPKEIEEVIVGIHGVIDCTVEGVPHAVLGEALRAVVVKTPQVDLSSEDVRAACAEKLASYKVPGEVVFKDNMDISSTGKKVKGTL
ncbi:class I adenylate-forming enzyme family protein [Marinilabilia rubra]|uniref:AMP-dependent synthetase n=1 Tax=Marinilabilia rubra TaxID=2162893 RepID=A0A2U2B4P1_9BACT|nr:AMP-binding protein [Marinilabilia rubra]PWD98004.1 AMP-dependent synthetase [Marinilabilia rubra]